MLRSLFLASLCPTQASFLKTFLWEGAEVSEERVDGATAFLFPALLRPKVGFLTTEGEEVSEERADGGAPFSLPGAVFPNDFLDTVRMEGEEVSDEGRDGGAVANE